MTRLALVVDDSSMVRQMVGRTLTGAGFQVIEGVNGADALAKLTAQTSKVTLILTDLNMPVMDGLEFIRRVRALPAHKQTPVLMLTTETQDAKKKEGRAAGATGWLTKPFNPDQMLQVVAKVAP
jgi:two-component system, chemotaxis family, chemotaxis protein CheY